MMHMISPEALTLLASMQQLPQLLGVGYGYGTMPGKPEPGKGDKNPAFDSRSRNVLSSIDSPTSSGHVLAHSFGSVTAAGKSDGHGRRHGRR